MNINWSWKRYVAPFPTPLEHNFFSPDTHPNGHYFYSPPILLLNNRNFQSFEWKRVKRPFFEPGKLENHTNEGKGKEINNRARRKKGREEKTAMVAHLISFYNGYFECFWLKKTQCLTVTFLKIQLDMYDPEKKLLCSLIEQILNFLFTKL